MEELTLEKLKEMSPGIFAEGVSTDSPEGIHMTGSGQQLRWVAVRGGIHDWAIYCHHAEHDAEWIKGQGDKTHNLETVKKLVPCNEEALEMYRR